MNIVDIVIIVLALIAFIVGAVKGFFGLTYGFVAFIFAVVLMVIITPTVSTPLYNTGLGTSIQELIIGKIGGLGDFMAAPLVNQEGTLYLLTEGGTTPKVFAEAVAGSKIPAFLISPLNSLIINIAKPAATPAEAVSLAGTVAPLISKLILSAVVGTVIFIVVLIIFGIIRKFADRLLEIKAIKVGDKIFGIITSCGILFTVVLGGLTVAAKFLSGNATIMGYINSSMILKLLYENNFLLSLF